MISLGRLGGTGAFPFFSILLAVTVFSAKPARAQVKLACGLVDQTNYDCSQWFPNCHEYISDVNYNANEDGEVQSSIEDWCCGRPFLVWDQVLWTDCLVAGPQQQAARVAGTGPARTPAAWSVPGLRGRGGPARPQPVYLRICTGDFELYVAPSP